MLEAELPFFVFHSNICLHSLPRECLKIILGQWLKELPQGWGPLYNNAQRSHFPAQSTALCDLVSL